MAGLTFRCDIESFVFRAPGYRCFFNSSIASETQESLGQNWIKALISIMMGTVQERLGAYDCLPFQKPW